MGNAAANLRAGVATPQPQVDLPIVAEEESEQTYRMMSGISTNLSSSAGDPENPFLGSLKELGNMERMLKQQERLYVLVMYCCLRYSI